MRRELGARFLAEGAAPPDVLDRAARADLLLLWQENPAAPEPFAARFAETHAALRHAVETAPDHAALRLHLADLLEWVRLHAVVADDLVEGLRRDPEAIELHRRLIDVHTSQGVVERLVPLYDELVPADAAAAHGPAATWYRGYVELLAGDLARKEQRYEDADVAYRTCRAQMDRAAALAPEWAASCEQTSFLASLGLAWSATRQGDLGRATALFLDLLELDPGYHEMPDGLGRTVISGIGVLTLEIISARDYATGIPLARRIAAVREDREDEASWWNNLGFLLREHATQVECGSVSVAGDSWEASRAIFRDSWAAYERAVELAPDDARIVNDAALIQAYHLRTELPRARKMLEHAVACGRAGLEALGANPPEVERFSLAQAMGDALENLGFVAYHVDEDFERATELFERSNASDSGERPVVDAYLAAIRGEREPVGDPFESSRRTVPGPNRAAPARVPWEPSFNKALARARAENRPVFVYYRGAGASERAGILDGYIREPRYVASFAGAVSVIADSNRSTHIDRRADGRRIPSHRHRTVTCAEHIRAAEEFLAWWEGQRGEEELALPEEGFYYLKPSGERFFPAPVSVPGRSHIAAALAQLAEEIGPPRPGPEPMELRRRLASAEAAEREEAAEQLLDTPSPTTRDLVESLLFDAGAGPGTRRAVVAAVARRTDEDARSLMNALVRQTADPALQRLAIEACRGPETLAALHHARNWSTSAENRALATRALGRTPIEEAEWRALLAQLVAAPTAQRAAAARALAASDAGARVLSFRLDAEEDADVQAAIRDALGR